jgi:hypothetical protein
VTAIVRDGVTQLWIGTNGGVSLYNPATSVPWSNFTSAFLYVGAAAVISGLWRVDDAATAHLMQQFYR